jgi:hypothetical protein
MGARRSLSDTPTRRNCSMPLSSSLWKLAARRAPGWLWAGLDRTATWFCHHGPRGRVRELEARLEAAQHDQVLLIRAIGRLLDDLEAAGVVLEPHLRLIRGGREQRNSYSHTASRSRDKRDGAS